MSLAPVLLLALLQGVAEFLPVSSSGHLAILGRLLGTRDAAGGVTLEVVLHLGTLLSVIAFYRRDLASLARGLARREAGAVRLVLLVALASLPAAIAGLLFADRIEAAFGDPALVAALLVVNGIILTASSAARRRSGGVGAAGALAAGLAQALAILPGISRSGSTISALVAAGVDPVRAARFSFLMSIPAVAGAGLLDAGSMGALPASDVPPLLAGLAVASLAGYASLALLIRVLGRGRMWVFGAYCTAAGLAAGLLMPGGWTCWL